VVAGDCRTAANQRGIATFGVGAVQPPIGSLIDLDALHDLVLDPDDVVVGDHHAVLDQITPLPVPWSWAMVTTDGSTLRTTSGMSPVAAWALGASTGAGAERACGSRPRVHLVRAAASKAATAGAISAACRRRARLVSLW
jgi:hypothetical protein